MPVEKLTQRKVEKLEAINGQRTTYVDESLPGFTVRVMPSGKRVYAVRYGKAGKAVTIGRVDSMQLDDARAEAKAILGRVAKGADPAAEKAAERRRKRNESATFKGLADRLVRDAELADTTRRAWSWMLTKRIHPEIGARAPEEIERRDVRELLERIAGQHGKHQSAEVLKIVRWVFRRAVESDLVAHDPTAGVKRPVKARARSVVLQRAQLRALWTACESAGIYGKAVQLAALVGVRRSEAFDAAWSEVDREAGVWRIPASRRKNRQSLDVPLTPSVVALLDSLPQGGPNVFPGRPEWAQRASARSVKPSNAGWESKLPWTPMRATSKAWARLLQAAGIVAPAAQPKSKKLPGRKAWTPQPVRFHDLRRTLRDTMTSELGVLPHVAEAVIGHADSPLVRTYAPSGVPLADKRRALEAWQRHVDGIVSGTDAAPKVVTFPGR